MTTPKEVEDKIAEKAIPEPNSGCWLWLGAVSTRGYGIVRLDGRTIKAHRASWTAFRGVIPDGLFVLHKCDQPSWVNPDHLWLGTDLDNNRDMRTKGRGVYPSGERNGRSKLSVEDVQFIRRTKGQISGYEMARRLGVTPALVNRIRRGESWKKSAEFLRRKEE